MSVYHSPWIHSKQLQFKHVLMYHDGKKASFHRRSSHRWGYTTTKLGNIRQKKKQESRKSKIVARKGDAKSHSQDTKQGEPEIHENKTNKNKTTHLWRTATVVKLKCQPGLCFTCTNEKQGGRTERSWLPSRQTVMFPHMLTEHSLCSDQDCTSAIHWNVYLIAKSFYFIKRWKIVKDKIGTYLGKLWEKHL